VLGSRQRPPKPYERERLEFVPPYSINHSHLHDGACDCSVGVKIRTRHAVLDILAHGAFVDEHPSCGPNPHPHPHLHLGRFEPADTHVAIVCDPTTEPTPTPPPYSPTATTSGIRPPTRLGLQYLKEYVAESYPRGIPQDTHDNEWTDYFQKPVDNSGHPSDPRYWRELDRQVRVKFPHPDPRIEQRTKAVTAIRQATDRRRQQQYKKPRLDAPRTEVASDPETPRKTPLQRRRKRTRNIRHRRRVLQQQIREDFDNLDTDPFRQGGLSQYNSADAPYAAIEWQELVKRYPEWYKD